MIKQMDFKFIQNYLKDNGFVFPNSEIYGGHANAFDYGPLGVLLLKNIKDLWWKEFVTKDPNVFPIESKLILNPLVWKSSGHIDKFTDLLIENKINNKRYRADHIIEDFDKSINVNALSIEEIEKFIKENVKEYDDSKTDWTSIKNFNLMYKTFEGVVENEKTPVYLRPELAQGIFVNYKNVVRNNRAKIPFGIAQIGASFRNEVSPKNFIFRTREFTQMELEFFVDPQDWKKHFDQFLNKINQFLIEKIGIKKENFRQREQEKDELAHYSNKTIDFEYNFPFGWGEIIGLANRQDFDLLVHQNSSGENLLYTDPINNKKFIPYVIEPSMGLDRLALMSIIDALNVEKEEDNSERIVLKLNYDLAPYKIAILPLIKKVHEEKAKEIFTFLIDKNISTTFDSSGTIGKRYRRQDGIGTFWCLTIDDKTLESDGLVTLRNRDTKKQVEINYKEIEKYLKENI